MRIRILPFLLLAVACAPEFVVDEATIPDIHQAMEEGRLTAEELVQSYIDRIEAYDRQGPYLNSIITVSEHALGRARQLDAALQESGLTGPLHGIPVIVKDNYDTHDLPTTNGTLAFRGAIPPDDAYQVRKLREAGAIILAKSNLAEFASSGAFTLSSVLPGFSRNPYDPTRVTAGSSGGTGAAVAANFGAVGLGSDTGSSIRGPSSHQALVGVPHHHGAHQPGRHRAAERRPRRGRSHGPYRRRRGGRAGGDRGAGPRGSGHP